MFAKMDNNTMLLLIAVVLVFLYFTMDKEEYRGISAGKKRGQMSGRAPGKVGDKKIGSDVAPVVEGYMNGYF